MMGRKKLGSRHFVPNFSQAFVRPILRRYVFFMLTKIESLGLLSGILGCLWMFVLVTNSQSFTPELVEYFRGGNIGGLIIGVLIGAGFVSVIIFAVNIIIGSRVKWVERSFLSLAFILSSAVLGSVV